MRIRDTRCCAAISAVVILATSEVLAQHADALLTRPHLRRVMLTAPEPEYPTEALAKHIQGTGVYDVWVRPETGVVIRVDVICSTGSKLLDDAAVRSLQHWRARPNAISRIRVPIRFCAVCR